LAAIVVCRSAIELTALESGQTRARFATAWLSAIPFFRLHRFRFEWTAAHSGVHGGSSASLLIAEDG
jgi:hypothetical protein